MKKLRVTVPKLCFGLLIIILGLAQACKKGSSAGDIIEQDRWVTKGVIDSSGNTYYVAATNENKLQIRIKDASGNQIFSEDFPTIDSAEIPKRRDSVFVVVEPTNRFISTEDVTISIELQKIVNSEKRQYIQLLSNINLKTKAFFSKKYKVDKPSDWTYVMHNGAVVAWFQNTILVREGTDENILGGGGFMGLGGRGTQLVCYERDFTIRYTKDIDAASASYPQSGGPFIPINDTDRVAFGINNGLLARYRIIVSIEEEWAGKKSVVWEMDLKKIHDLPVGYKIHITDYKISSKTVTTSYTIYDEEGKVLENHTRDWDINTGMPLTQWNS